MSPTDRFEIGARGEEEVMKTLREWWGGDQWATRTWGETGSDISAPTDFPFAVEVKLIRLARVRWFFRHGIVFYDFWPQCVRNARLERKRPMLCLKAEGEWFATVPRRLPAGLRLPPLFVSVRTPRIGSIAVIPLHDLIEWNPRDGGKFVPERVEFDDEVGAFYSRGFIPAEKAGSK